MSPLQRLLFPGSIAFIGGSECEVAIRQTLALGYEGSIFAIHPKRTDIAGITCLRSLDDLPHAPDAAFVAVKRELAVDTVANLSIRGCGGAVVYASGFAETGEEGGRLQASLLEAAKSMPIMGPNCYGFVNYLAKVALWPDEQGGRVRDSGVAIISQSGNMAVNFTMTRRGLPLAAVFSVGNQADVDIAALLEELARNDRITAVGVHIEGLKDPSRFATAAETARSNRKPVVALKTGRSEQGAQMALSHTNSLAGSDALYDAMFKRHGVARTYSVTAFVEALKFLHHGGPLKGSNLVSMSCSGGEAALIADLAGGREIKFPQFNAPTKARIAKTLNEYSAIGNPLDYHTFIWNQDEKLTTTFSAVLSGGFDLAMLVLDIPTVASVRPDTWLVTAEAFMKAQRATGARSALVASLSECLPEYVAAELSEAGIAPMAGLEDALTAFEAAVVIGRSWEHKDVPTLPQPVDRRQSLAVLLTEHEAKRRLQQFGLTVPKNIECPVDAAPVMAENLGFPVAVKASGSIAHKTEAGAVALSLHSQDEVRAATRRMKGIAERVLVEQMVEGAVCELIIGIKNDAQFGLGLVIGAGGTLAELLTDTVTLLLPAPRREIEEGLDSLRVAKLLSGYRGKIGDRAAALNAIAAVARFAEAHADSIEELDVNPLLVLPEGQGAVAVDALIRLRE